MGRQKRVLTAAVLAVGLTVGAPATASAQLPGRRSAVLRSVRATVPLSAPTAIAGAISGSVSDEHGGPLAGVMVTVVGVTMAMDITDERGRFSLDRLPTGQYVLAAHRKGFVAAPRQVVRVGDDPLPVYRLQLRKLDAAAPTTGTIAGTRVESRPIIAAGFDLPQLTVPEGTDEHPHTETAWRIRHLPRSILKDAADAVPVGDDDRQQHAGAGLPLRGLVVDAWLVRRSAVHRRGEPAHDERVCAG